VSHTVYREIRREGCITPGYRKSLHPQGAPVIPSGFELIAGHSNALEMEESFAPIHSRLDSPRIPRFIAIIGGFVNRKDGKDAALGQLAGR